MKSTFIRNVMKQYKITQKDLAQEWSKLDGKPKFQEVVSRTLSRENIDSIIFAQAIANLVLRPVGTIVNESLLDDPITKIDADDFKKDLVVKPLTTEGDVDNNGVLIQCPAKKLNRNVEYFHWHNVLNNMRPTLNMGDSLIVHKIYDLDILSIKPDTIVLCFDKFGQIHLGRTLDKIVNEIEIFSDDIYAYRKASPVETKNIKSIFEVSAFVSYDTDNKATHFMDEIEALKSSVKTLSTEIKSITKLS